MDNRVVDERKLRLVQDIVNEILGEGFTVTITANYTACIYRQCMQLFRNA